MFNFPEIKNIVEPPLTRMSLEDYVAFCAFCMENNPKITPQNCMERRSGEESITEPFRIPCLQNA
jgi:hypothetical protein